jgi:18S rRNA (adenine1779-N6/adenine1780-N6)-dimethyltransferase
MPKQRTPKRNGRGSKSPYGSDAKGPPVGSAVFKMNTDLGQHVLKNPGVAQAIVDKADLKQSDVSFPSGPFLFLKY